MNELLKRIENAKKICITGHTNPDGDCAGSTLGMYNYIKKNYPEKSVTVFLSNLSDKFAFLNGYDDIHQEIGTGDKDYDLMICLDCSDDNRPGGFMALKDLSKDIIVIDHHVTHKDFGSVDIVDAQGSSTCELLYSLLEDEKIDKETAKCLYLGIVHDTGVFKYAATSEDTMKVAGRLMKKGIDYTSIIDESFYERTFTQQKVTGYCLERAELLHDGKIIVSQISAKTRASYNATTLDLDGIIADMRNTKGVECAVFMYEINPRQYKISLRSNKYVDVSKVAANHNGGGHVRAAGCNITGDGDELLAQIIKELEEQL